MKSKTRSYTPQWRPGRNNQKKRRNRLIIGLIISFLAVMLLVALVGTALFFLPAGSKGIKGYVYVKSDTEVSDIALQLRDGDLLDSHKLFNFYAGITDLRGKLRPGRYAVDGGMSIYTLMKRLTRDAQSPVKVSFSSVRTQDELLEKLTANLAMTANDLKELLRDPAYCASMGFDTVTVRCLFVPDTYEFYWNVSPKQLVEKIYNNYQSFWTPARLDKAAEENLSPTDISIIASIVEEESAKTDEYSRIAGLYINRLRRDMPLQADPTVKYALGDFALKRILSKHTTVASPYNTYRVVGLPPGPIRYPQKSTLEKVLNYEQHRYIYMCAKSDLSGYHAFANNYTDHLQNAYLYRKKLDAMGVK